MFGFIALLSFGRSLATECTSLNNELCVARLTIIELNPVELKYYLFIMSLDKCSGSCKCNSECKNYCTCINDYNCNPSTCIFENGKYLEHIVDDSVIICDEIIYVIDIVPTNVSINSDDKNIRWKMNCYSLLSVSFISDHITIYNHYYLLSLCKTLVKTKRKPTTVLKNIKIENKKF